MTWLSISAVPVPYVDANGDAYSGAVLKFYSNGTSSNINLATDSTGGTQVSSVALNASGYPAVSGNVIIPHLEESYKVSLYATQTAADADSGALWSVDELTAPVIAGANTDINVKVSSNDTSAGYLNGKLVAGDNIGLTEGSDGGNETLTIAFANAGQIVFPATQNPSSNVNTLDDYEEGEFQASLVSQTGSVTLATNDTMAYTKIGRVVHIQGSLQVASVSAPTGTLYMTGLPFASANLTELAEGAHSLVAMTGASSALVNYCYQNIVAGATQAGLWETDGNSAPVGVSAKTQAGTIFNFGFSYVAA